MSAFLQVRPQLLGEAGQDGHVTGWPTLRMDQANLRRLAVEIEIVNSDLHELADPRTSQKERLDH